MVGRTEGPLGAAASLVQEDDLYLAQRLLVGQQGEGEGDAQDSASEVLHLLPASMGRHAAAKCAEGQVRHKLLKHQLAFVHGAPLRDNARDPASDARRSNRDQTISPETASRSLTHDALM